jgi:hypothetical protein
MTRRDRARISLLTSFAFGVINEEDRGLPSVFQKKAIEFLYRREEGMRKWGVWLVLAAMTGMAAFLVVGCPSPEPIPEEPEKVTETKPEDINTVMERWSKDLGVECTYCHTADDKGNLNGYTDKGKPSMRWAMVSREFGVECGFCHTPEPPGGLNEKGKGAQKMQKDPERFRRCAKCHGPEFSRKSEESAEKEPE